MGAGKIVRYNLCYNLFCYKEALHPLHPKTSFNSVTFCNNFKYKGVMLQWGGIYTPTCNTSVTPRDIPYRKEGLTKIEFNNIL